MHDVCGGKAIFVVGGDEKLRAAYVKFADDIAAALSQTIALKGPIQDLGNVVTSAIEKETGLTAAATACFATSFASVTSAQASLAVSVKASQAISGE